MPVILTPRLPSAVALAVAGERQRQIELVVATQIERTDRGCDAGALVDGEQRFRRAGVRYRIERAARTERQAFDVGVGDLAGSADLDGRIRRQVDGIQDVECLAVTDEIGGACLAGEDAKHERE
jgi:hypothetical protein